MKTDNCITESIERQRHILQWFRDEWRRYEGEEKQDCRNRLTGIGMRLIHGEIL